MKYLKRCVLLATFAATLAACGGSDTRSTGPPAAQSETGTTASEPGPAGTANAAALCDFLRSEIPRLEPVGSDVGRLAQLTVHLYNWTEEQKIDATFDVDQLTNKNCPDVRSEVLKLIGTESFSSAF
jgi:hypothetical protein